MDLDLTLVEKAFAALRAGNVHAALTYLQHFTDDQPNPTDEARLNYARQVLKSDYIQRLEEAVNSVREDYCDGTYAGNKDEFHQDIDHVATNFVSNEEDAQACLLFSPNASAVYLEHGEMEAAGDWRGGIPWQGMAYYAFRADMCEELQSSGVDLNRDPPDADEIAILCDDCGEYRVAIPGEDTCNACRKDAGNEQCEKCHAWWSPDELDDDYLCTECASQPKEPHAQ